VCLYHLQALSQESPSIIQRIVSHFHSMWNVLDFIMFSLFICAVILRCVLNSDQFDWARMIYTLDLSMFYIRFLQVFFVEKSMGPKVIIIRGMVRPITHKSVPRICRIKPKLFRTDHRKLLCKYVIVIRRRVY
jgi:hypothetical protein